MSGMEGLNIFEQYWVWFYSLHSSPMLVTAFLAFLVHEIIFFGGWIPYYIVGSIPSFKKYKLQPEKEVTRQDHLKALRGVLLSHFLVQSPLMLSFHPTAISFGIEVTEVPFPPLWKICLQVLFCALFEDTYHYWAHRALHWGVLYKKIHKVHHEFSAPFGITAEYAHPIETIILGMGTIGGPFVLALAFKVHVITVLAWMSFRLFQTIEAHSGYEFPISLRTIVPFWSGADHHDYHHQAFVNCYSTSFRWWDHIMGTDLKYKAFREKQLQEKFVQNKDSLKEKTK
eukprot:TRINITY_DN419_c0_g1_i1.p1 TRINITY_DN419_c0_g1~~TRINITY_DN419_c0_g1_i1.p1  ORF type:complete len:285 (+),score=101.43 TRINITY_DN419_c0_g1_i1:155-1009(+)